MLILPLLLPCLAPLAQDVDPDWFRDVAISPDGTTIAFCHAGDIYTVPASGGRAFPVTIHEAYESSPVWSRDGSKLAFASDRTGNDDVYVMPSTGGPATRLTFHSASDTPTDFTPDGDAVIFSSSRMDHARSALFPSGVLSELYRVSLEGGTPTMLSTTPMLNARYDDRGGRLVYEDRKGFENELRKHHVSSIARDVWILDLETGEHVKRTEFQGEDREPHLVGDTIHFLSERSGDFNVHRMNARPGSPVTQITSFEHHPVRDLSVADDGTLAFSWHGGIFTMRGDQQPTRLDVDVSIDGRRSEPVAHTMRGGATEFAVSPSGKEVAFVARGEVFVTAIDYTTTRRITDTPEQERMVSFSPDGRSLLYAGERDGSWNIYEATLGEDELHFFSATVIDESPVLDSDADEFQARYSPDGTKIAYLHDRHEIRVLETESGDVTTVMPGDTFYSYSDGDHWFEFSPDGQWIASHFYDHNRLFFPEIALVRADGSEPPVNISNSGYSDAAPKFAMGGEALVWASDRYGERSHGSFGSEDDVLGTFLTRDAWDRFRLSKEDLELREELEEKKKEDDADGDEEETGTDDDTPDADANPSNEVEDENDHADDDAPEVEPVDIEFEGLDTRRERLTLHASDLADYALSPDGAKLFYLARFEKGYDLWVRDFREESTRILAKLDANDASMTLTSDGANIFVLASGSISRINAESGERKPIAFAASMTLDAAAERRHMFEHVWRQTKEKFYRADMHNVDWDFYRSQYRPKLEGVTNNHDFAVILSELLGELNASHTGGRYRAGGDPSDARTAALGAFLEPADDEGFTLVEILVNGPLDRPGLDIENGDRLVAVDGTRLTPDVNLHALLDRKAGERLRITVADDEGERDLVVRPVSWGAQSQLLYERWVRQRNEIVERESGGRLGYAHVRGMNDNSFRDFYEDVMGEDVAKEGLVVDTRFNGGGWLHDDLATFLTGVPYVDLYPRNDLAPGIRYIGDPAERWTRPSIVVMSESNYSDAHFFPWVYTQLGIGDTVGMPVPGTATAVWWETLFTGDIVFGIPQVGTKGSAGTFLENDQLEPTHQVPLPPEKADAGDDTQLVEAVRILLDQLDR